MPATNLEQSCPGNGCAFFTSPLPVAGLLSVLPCPVPTSVLGQLFMDSSSKWEQRTPSGLKITWSQKVNCIFNPDQVSRSRILCSPASACSDTSAEVLRGSLVLLRLFRPGFSSPPSAAGLASRPGTPFLLLPKPAIGGRASWVFGALLSATHCVNQVACST